MWSWSWRRWRSAGSLAGAWRRPLLPLQAGCWQGLLTRNASRVCFKNRVASRKGARQPSPRKQMVASDLHNILKDNRLVAVYHFNDLSTEEWNSVRFQLMNAGVRLKVLPSKVAAKALESTRYQNLSLLFKGASAIAYGRDSTSLAPLLSGTKTVAKLHLLGGILDDQLFTPKGLHKYAALPSIDALRGEMIGLLVSPKLAITQVTQASYQRLSTLLGQICS